jgi:hypothetical protein
VSILKYNYIVSRGEQAVRAGLANGSQRTPATAWGSFPEKTCGFRSLGYPRHATEFAVEVDGNL